MQYHFWRHISDVFHHLHVRKRVHQNLTPYPGHKKKQRLIDRVILLVGVITPLMIIPQVVVIWQSHEAGGVSLIAWSAYTLASVVWALYGILHKELPIILMHSLNFGLNLLVVIGTILYG